MYIVMLRKAAEKHHIFSIQNEHNIPWNLLGLVSPKSRSDSCGVKESKNQAALGNLPCLSE